MHVTQLEAGAITTAFGTVLGGALARLQQRAASRRAAHDELHRAVGELFSASAELVMTLQTLRTQHESPTGRWVQRLLLFTMEFAARHGHEFPNIAKGDNGGSGAGEAFLATAIPAAAAASVSLLRWDRDAVTDVRTAGVASMAQIWRAIAALRSAGDQRFQRKVEDLMHAVEGLHGAYGKNDQRWISATDELTRAIREVATDANRVTVLHRRWRLRKRDSSTGD